MHQILHYFSIQTVDNYNRFIQKLRKKNNDSNLLCQFRRRTTFTFSLMLFLRTYSYKASFYHNVIKAQWQRSSNKQQGSRSANKLPPPKKKNLNIFICDVYQGHALLAPYSDQAVLLLILNTHIVPLDKGFAVTLKDVSGSKVKVIAELIIKSLSGAYLLFHWSNLN